MTSLSQYLRAERLDRTEPVSFYVPGATSWLDRNLLALLSDRLALLSDRLDPVVEVDILFILPPEDRADE